MDCDIQCHRDPLLVPVEMNGIELPEETNFRLFGLTFTRPMDWKPYIQSIAKAASRKMGSLYRAQLFPFSWIHLVSVQIYNSAMYGVPGGAPKSHVLDLLDRVQNRVISLVGSGQSSDWQALSHRMDVASLSLFYRYYYGKCSSELADLVPPKFVNVRSTRRCIVIQLILICEGLSCINQAFFLAHQPLELPQ